jgi:hypothetical protein
MYRGRPPEWKLGADRVKEEVQLYLLSSYSMTQYGEARLAGWLRVTQPGEICVVMDGL